MQQAVAWPRASSVQGKAAAQRTRRGQPRSAARVAAAPSSSHTLPLCLLSGLALRNRSSVRRRALPFGWGGAQPSSPEPDEEQLQNEAMLLPLASALGILTGACIVLFFVIVHALQDFLNPLATASLYWPPLLGGLVVAQAYSARGGPACTEGTALPAVRKAAVVGGELTVERRARRAVLKAGLAAVTLGTGNSLGPEGPAVEIGANVAALLGRFGRQPASYLAREDARLGLLASGCAAGVAAGFNAPLAGLFFAVEVVRPPRSEATSSLASRLLAAALAATVVQIGLGTSPAVKGIEFSALGDQPWMELPLYMLLGALCGAAASAFSLAKGAAGPAFEKLLQAGVPRALHPIVGSLLVVIVTSAAGLPELLYQGFENVNGILAHAADLAPSRLFAMTIGKIFLTAVCTACGLVGGVFAPSLFIGASSGALYGQAVASAAHLLSWETSPATDYAAVGAAAVLASICDVPLTAVVLLLELTAGTDYAICLPLIAAVGVSVFVEKALQRRPDALQLRNMSTDSLQRVAMMSEEEQASAIFNMLDKNRDGSVSREEFNSWFAQAEDALSTVTGKAGKK